MSAAAETHYMIFSVLIVTCRIMQTDEAKGWKVQPTAVLTQSGVVGIVTFLGCFAYPL